MPPRLDVTTLLGRRNQAGNLLTPSGTLEEIQAATPAPAPVTPPPTPQPQEESFLSRAGDLVTNPGFRNILALAAQAITQRDPNSAAAQLAQFAGEQAQSEQFSDLVGRARAGEDISQPSGLAGVGVTPEMIQEASKLALGEQATRAQTNLHTIQAEGIAPFEAQFAHEIDLANIRATGGARPKTIDVNIGPDGRQTDARDKHAWVVGPDGRVDFTNPNNYIAPRTQAAPGGVDAGTQHRQWHKQAMKEAAEDPIMQQFGKLIRDNEGNVVLQFHSPTKGQKELQTLRQRITDQH